MLAPISRRRAISWVLLTIITPLSISLFAANFYVAVWYYRMAVAGTPHQGPPPLAVIQRGVIVTAGIGLWATVLLWWFLHRKTASFAELFATQSNGVGKDLAYGAILGGLWVAVYGALGWPPFSSLFVFDEAKLISIPTSLSAGFCEEFLFRGFVILLIARTGAGSKAQILWSSLAFGAGHIFWGPVGMLFTVALGVSFALVTLRRGNVWAAVAAHTILDLCVEPGLMQKAMSFASQG